MPINQDLVQSVMRHEDFDGVYHIIGLPDAEQGDSPPNLAQMTNALAAKQYTLTAGANISIDNTNPLVPVISSTGGTPTEIDGGTWE